LALTQAGKSTDPTLDGVKFKSGALQRQIVARFLDAPWKFKVQHDGATTVGEVGPGADVETALDRRIFREQHRVLRQSNGAARLLCRVASALWCR